MEQVTIRLDTIEKVKKFVNVTNKLDGEFDIVSDRYRIDAKSIMGIFSLDLSKPLKLEMHGGGDLSAFRADLEPFVEG